MIQEFNDDSSQMLKAYSACLEFCYREYAIPPLGKIYTKRHSNNSLLNHKNVLFLKSNCKAFRKLESSH